MSPSDNITSPPAMPKVAVVVLNYQGETVLPGLLASLESTEYSNYNIYLVDNASTDNGLAVAEKWLDKLPMEIIKNDENLLFSRGNNVGIRKALVWRADFVFLLNNDTVVPPSLISELVKFLTDHSKAGIAGPMIHFENPKGVIWGAGGQVSTWWGLVRHRGIREKDIGQFSEASKVDYVSGAAMMVRTPVFSKIGLLDPDLPMYFEDTDFCFRARKKGFEVWYIPTAPLIHLVSVAAGGQRSWFKIRKRIRAGFRFFARHARWYQWPTILLGQVYEAVRVSLLVIKRFH